MVTSGEGDITDNRHGLFRDDTRFLSLYEAKINGKTLVTLTANNTTHYSSAFYLTNGDLPGRIEKESLAVERKRFIEKDVREDFSITNLSNRALSFSLSFRVDSDFADLFLVKSRVFYGTEKYTKYSIGSDLRVEKKFIHRHDNAFQFSCFDEKTKFRAETLVWFSRKGEVQRNSISYKISLKPKERFDLIIVIVLLSHGEKRIREYTSQYF